jgi:hypothetical protein
VAVVLGKGARAVPPSLLRALRAGGEPPKTFRAFVDLISEDYLQLMEEGLVSWGFTRTEAKAHATLYLAAFRGLLLDLLTTGERTRVDAAVKVLAADLERALLERGPGLQTAHPTPAHAGIESGRR